MGHLSLVPDVWQLTLFGPLLNNFKISGPTAMFKAGFFVEQEKYPKLL